MSKQVQGILFPVGEDTEPLPISVGDHININALVGGHFDAVRREFTPEELSGEHAPDGATPFVAVGYVHDEGRIINLPLNKLATVVFGQELYGDVVLVSGTSPDGEYDGENYDIPAWFADAVHNGSLAEATVLVEKMSEVASCLALAVREGLATREDVLLAIVGVANGDENAEEILSMLTTYGRLRRAGEIDAYVSTDTDLPSDWEVTDEELEQFFNNLGGN
jgi:hypothetical protein